MDASKNETETTIPEGPRLSEIAVALDRLMYAILTFCKETFYDDGMYSEIDCTKIYLFSLGLDFVNLFQ